MPATDTFSDHSTGLTGPVSAAEHITPSNSTDLSHVTRALYIGGSGDVQVTLAKGQTVTLAAAAGGAFYPLRITRVLATGTTATGLVGFF